MHKLDNHKSIIVESLITELVLQSLLSKFDKTKSD